MATSSSSGTLFLDIDSIALHHEVETKEHYREAVFERLESPLVYPVKGDEPAATILRRGRISKTCDGPEYTLYIDHPRGVLTLVLLCPEGEDDRFLPLLLRVGETALLRDMTDQRLERLRTTEGRIAVFWNRARYSEVLMRSNVRDTWAITDRFVEILEPVRTFRRSSGDAPATPAFVGTCEFDSVKIPVRPEWHVEFPGEGWGIRLWNPGDVYPRPQVILRVEDAVEFLQHPERLLFFTSTRYPFSPDGWPGVPGVDSLVDLGLG